MSTYQLCKDLIAKGSSVVTADKLDVFLLAGRITNEEYTELMELLHAVPIEGEETTEAVADGPVADDMEANG